MSTYLIELLCRHRVSANKVHFDAAFLAEAFFLAGVFLGFFAAAFLAGAFFFAGDFAGDDDTPAPELWSTVAAATSSAVSSLTGSRLALLGDAFLAGLAFLVFLAAAFFFGAAFFAGALALVGVLAFFTGDGGALPGAVPSPSLFTGDWDREGVLAAAFLEVVVAFLDVEPLAVLARGLAAAFFLPAGDLALLGDAALAFLGLFGALGPSLVSLFTADRLEAVPVLVRLEGDLLGLEPVLVALPLAAALPFRAATS